MDSTTQATPAQATQVPNQHRSDLVPFLLDVLDFMIEQIEFARSDFDRAGAIDAASGVTRAQFRCTY
jgi:hypothetical protein